jgi:PilZ domain
MPTQDIMSKVSDSVPTNRTMTQTERRASRRCKITQLMRIRPSDPEKDHFDDLRGTISVSRTGVYFHSSEAGYEVGMRLFVTMPYVQGALSTGREYLAEVVRVDNLINGMNGVGFKLLMEMGQQGSWNNHSSSIQRK